MPPAGSREVQRKIAEGACCCQERVQLAERQVAAGHHRSEGGAARCQGSRALPSPCVPPRCADALAQGELRSVKGDASNIGRTAESREKEVDRLKASIKALEETKKTLQADKASVTGDKINLELQLKSTGARLAALEKENEKLRDKAGKIGEARSEAQQVQAAVAFVVVLLLGFVAFVLFFVSGFVAFVLFFCQVLLLFVAVLRFGSLVSRVAGAGASC
jgi:hypothetical protein